MEYLDIPGGGWLVAPFQYSCQSLGLIVHGETPLDEGAYFA